MLYIDESFQKILNFAEYLGFAKLNNFNIKVFNNKKKLQFQQTILILNAMIHKNEKYDKSFKNAPNVVMSKSLKCLMI